METETTNSEQSVEGTSEAGTPTEATDAAKAAAPAEAGVEPSLLDDPTLFEPKNPNMRWYIVHTYSGFEQKARVALQERIRSFNKQQYFGRILIPTENVVELVKGQKKTSTRKFFPGYIMVQMELNDDTWHLVRETPRVTGFVGDSRNPPALRAVELKRILAQMTEGASKAKPKVQFEVSEMVRVIEGPFANFNGSVEEVKPEKGKLRVLVSIFGRATPVELDFVQVEKI